MLYNPWLGRKFPFPEEAGSGWTAASLKQNVQVREFSSQFLSQTVNRESVFLLHKLPKLWLSGSRTPRDLEVTGSNHDAS